MEKRSVTFGEYKTADYGWTLGPWKLTDPEQKTNYVERTGGDGSWDLSTVMTGGIPRYKNRTLTVPLELSEGTREDREEIINEMVKQLDGLEHRIVMPDRPDYYLVGRVHVAVEYSDLAHAKVVITCVVEPWFYKARETIVVLNEPIAVSTDAATFTLWNNGRKVVTPVLDVKGTASLTFNGNRTSLTDGTGYVWPALQLAPGANTLVYTGSSTSTPGETLTLTYREAVLR